MADTNSDLHVFNGPIWIKPVQVHQSYTCVQIYPWMHKDKGQASENNLSCSPLCINFYRDNVRRNDAPLSQTSPPNELHIDSDCRIAWKKETHCQLIERFFNLLIIVMHTYVFPMLLENQSSMANFTLQFHLREYPSFCNPLAKIQWKAHKISKCLQLSHRSVES